MKIVLDTNIIISAIIKNSLTRKLILNKKFELLVPSFSLSEINKHKEEICKKAKISPKQFYILLEKLFNYIKIVNSVFYDNFIKKASKLIKDIYDVPFVACALALNCPIWSDNKHFKQQNKIKIFTTKEMFYNMDLI